MQDKIIIKHGKTFTQARLNTIQLYLEMGVEVQLLTVSMGKTRGRLIREQYRRELIEAYGDWLWIDTTLPLSDTYKLIKEG